MLSGLLMLCLMPISANGQVTSSKSDTLSYEQAVDAIIRLDADLCACEEKYRLEQEKTRTYQKQAAECVQGAKVAKKKVFWGKVWAGVKTFSVGLVVGVVVGVFIN